MVYESRPAMTSNVRWVSKGGADRGDTMEKVGRHILFGGYGCVRRQTGDSARGGADKMSVMKTVREHILRGREELPLSVDRNRTGVLLR